MCCVNTDAKIRASVIFRVPPQQFCLQKVEETIRLSFLGPGSPGWCVNKTSRKRSCPLPVQDSNGRTFFKKTHSSFNKAQEKYIVELNFNLIIGMNTYSEP